MPSSSPAWYTNCALAFAMTADGSVGLASGQAYGAVTNYWSAITAATNVCLKCNDGFQLSFAALNSATAASTGNVPYPGCVQITNCASPTTYYGGLPTYLNAMINCHSCNTGKVPIVSFEFNAGALSSAYTNAFLNYALGSTVAIAGLAFQCAAAPTALIATATTATSAIANCGVFGVLNPVTTSTSNTVRTLNGLANFCLACNSGFFPTYFNANTGANSGSFIPYYAVTACTASANCDASPPNMPWNACGRCSTASLTATPPIYYGYADHSFMNCYKSSTPNCFILSGTTLDSSNPNPCKVCMAGYFLNQDGYCDLMTIPNIATGGSFVQAYYASQFIGATIAAGWDALFVRYHYALSFQASQVGASACTGAYIRAPALVAAPMLCIGSTYLSSNVPWPTPATNDKFILNCAKYSAGVGNALNGAAPFYKCAVCNSGYIPKLDMSACVTAIANCLNAQTSTANLCATCAANYWNVNGACSQTTVTNCAVLVNTATSTAQATIACQTCKSGFYLTSAGACTQGTVNNCMTYTNAQAAGCLSCLAGYVLITLSNSNVYCYPVPASLNCVIAASSVSIPRGLSQGYISCTTCTFSIAAPTKPVPWSAQTTTTLAQTMCLPFVAITNCLTYNQASSSVLSNSYLCTACATGFFLSSSGASCSARTVNPAGCATWVANLDQCATCNAGFFLNTLGTLCIAFPIGVPNCAIFNTATNCSQCATGYYPSSAGICIISTVISNCNVYSANYTCSACISGFWLQNATTCTQASATNCLTFTSATACATCAFGYQLATSNSITSCTQIVIANCALLNPSNQLICGTCNTGYYLNANNVCTPVTTTVANCLYYASATQCQTCTAGFFLSADQLTCSNAANTYIDPNCATPFLTAVANCAQCSFGYLMGSSGCTPCPLFNSGCGICDSSNATGCLLCQNTYYMNTSGACQLIPVILINTTNTTTNTTVAGVNILSAWLTLVLILALVWRN